MPYRAFGGATGVGVERVPVADRDGGAADGHGRPLFLLVYPI
jgi:hypothetical protein